MNKTVSMKKAITLVTVISMLVAMIGAFGVVNANAAETEVNMYSTEVYFSKYGITQRVIYIKTDADSYDQSVTVHYNYLDGEEWRDAEASYFKTLSDGSKLWKAMITSYNTEYAIKYTANGNTYWDNNGGSNYTTESLGCAPITVNRGGPVNSYNHQVYATLQNYAYDKNVTLRYTTDSWRTYSDIQMNYQYTNNNGTEDWAATLPYLADINGFEYCVRYEVNGETFWANNFNENYNASYRVYP